MSCQRNPGERTTRIITTIPIRRQAIGKRERERVSIRHTSGFVLCPQSFQFGLGVEKGAQDLVTDINDAPGEEGSCAVHADSIIDFGDGSPSFPVHQQAGGRDRQERRSGRHCLHLCPDHVYRVEKSADEGSQQGSCSSRGQEQDQRHTLIIGWTHVTSTEETGATPLTGNKMFD